MPDQTAAELTGLLNRMLQGDEAAGNRAMGAIQGALRRIASAKLRRERPDHLLDTGSLLNEALLRLFGTRSVAVQNRQHFTALVCLLMKRVLIDFGRRKDPVYQCLDEATAHAGVVDGEKAMALELALDTFQRLDADAYEVFRLQVAGMTARETAGVLGCSEPTVNRRLKRARTWMFKELSALLTVAGR